MVIPGLQHLHISQGYQCESYPAVAELFFNLDVCRML